VRQGVFASYHYQENALHTEAVMSADRTNSNQNTSGVDARHSTFNDVRGDQENRYLVLVCAPVTAYRNLVASRQNGARSAGDTQIQAIGLPHPTSNNVTGDQINTYYIFVCDGRAAFVALGLGIAGIAGWRLLHIIRD